MTDTKLRPICYPCNEDKDLFDNLRDALVANRVAIKLAYQYETAPEDIRKQYYIECDKPTPRGKAEALFRIIAYHLDMNVLDVRAYLFWKIPSIYIELQKFAAKLPCAKRKAKDSEDIDTTIHALVADYLAKILTAQHNAMNAVCTDRIKHGEDEED